MGIHEGPPYYLSNPLWDGKGCGTGDSCCAQVGMPWFYRKLLLPVAEDFEVCICKSDIHAGEDIAVENLNCLLFS